MAQVTITIDIGQGERTIDFDPEDITLGFLEDLEEAQTSNKWGPLTRALGGLLGLARDEQRAITLRQFKQIAQALRESSEAVNSDPKGT